MERKRERIDELRAQAHELRNKSKSVEHSVTAPKEQMELLISSVLELHESINELHATTVEILEALNKIATPIPERNPARKEKPTLSLKDGILRLINR